jgi:hypothetical protein
MTTTAVNTITTAAITPPITADFVEELCSVVPPSDDFPIKDINFYQTVLFLIVSGFFGVEILICLCINFYFYFYQILTALNKLTIV